MTTAYTVYNFSPAARDRAILEYNKAVENERLAFEEFRKAGIDAANSGASFRKVGQFNRAKARYLEAVTLMHQCWKRVQDLRVRS